MGGGGCCSKHQRQHAGDLGLSEVQVGFTHLATYGYGQRYKTFELGWTATLYTHKYNCMSSDD